MSCHVMSCMYVYILIKRLHSNSDNCQIMEFMQLTNHPHVQDKGLARSLPTLFSEAHIHDDPREPEVAAKYQRRADRFLTLLESGYRVLFIYTMRLRELKDPKHFINVAHRLPLQVAKLRRWQCGRIVFGWLWQVSAMLTDLSTNKRLIYPKKAAQTKGFTKCGKWDQRVLRELHVPFLSRTWRSPLGNTFGLCRLSYKLHWTLALLVMERKRGNYWTWWQRMS